MALWLSENINQGSVTVIGDLTAENDPAMYVNAQVKDEIVVENPPIYQVR